MASSEARRAIPRNRPNVKDASSDVILGFDPGGQERFGWAVLNSGKPPLALLGSGVASTGREAVRAARALAGPATIRAAAIDSPLFWSVFSGRAADQLLRDKLAPFQAASTVLEVNSLRGACLVQGVLAAVELRAMLPSLPISESHPKALMHLLGVDPRREVRAAQLSPWIRGVLHGEHERDAAVGVLSAWAMLARPTGWCDLSRVEVDTYQTVPDPLGYWMPVAC